MRTSNVMFSRVLLAIGFDLQAFKDIGCEREILDLRVKCSNNAKNCEWTGELREVKVIIFFLLW